MRSLDTAREVCEQYHPGLCARLADIPLLDRESAGSPVIKLFRDHGGPGLLVPSEYSGSGADALEAVRVMRAVASYSPSLGAAVTMHHFTMAMLFSLAQTAARLTLSQLELMSRIAPQRLLVASGWAEGKPDQNILIPAVTAQPVEGGYLVNGGKKPCSLSRSMDLLTASVALPVGGEHTLAVLLIPADSPGITVHPFWNTWVLADPSRLDDLQTAGFVWFEMLISSVYVGAASSLVERALRRGRGAVTDRAAAGVQLESAVALLEGVARGVRDGVSGDEAVAAVLVSRFAAQQALAEATDRAAELLGGIAYMQSSEISYLISATRPLVFHPPSRASTAEALVDYFGGEPLRLS